LSARYGRSAKIAFRHFRPLVIMLRLQQSIGLCVVAIKRGAKTAPDGAH
jgi:hypothetical protein